MTTSSAPLVTWQDLCIDALDVQRQAEFWAAVSGLARVGDPGHPTLKGPTPAHTIWVNEVDRPHLVKNRTHLDVDVASLDDVVALGATVLAAAEETGLGWTRCADPEGNEFCAFVRDPARLASYRLHGIGVDCVDPEAQATWWARLFGTEVVHDPAEGWWTLEGIAVDDRMTIDFNAVPEPRSVPNRLHWDVRGDVEAVLAAGATHLWDGRSWTVLADPEGNEFCVFAP